MSFVSEYVLNTGLTRFLGILDISGRKKKTSKTLLTFYMVSKYRIFTLMR